jgi:hypothetical protein
LGYVAARCDSTAPTKIVRWSNREDAMAKVERTHRIFNDEPTINGIVEGFIASTDWGPVDQTIRVDLSVDVREYAT